MESLFKSKNIVKKWLNPAIWQARSLSAILGTIIGQKRAMHLKSYIAILLTGVYLIGLGLQFAPILAKSASIASDVEKMCPKEDGNESTDYAFSQASNSSEQGVADNIFIPCLSSQQNASEYKGLSLRFNPLRLLGSIKTNYQSPELALDPFPPKLA